MRGQDAMPGLRVLDLSHMAISDRALDSMCAGLDNEPITEVSFASTCLGKSAAERRHFDG